jgi:hypothetical protein
VLIIREIMYVIAISCRPSPSCFGISIHFDHTAHAGHVFYNYVPVYVLYLCMHAYIYVCASIEQDDPLAKIRMDKSEKAAPKADPNRPASRPSSARYE